MELSTILIYGLITTVILYLLHKYLNGPMTPLDGQANVANKLIIVTGATNGIGKEAAFKLLEKGARVIFACRDEIRTNNLINSVTNLKMRSNAYYIKLDLTSYRSIKSFVKEFKLRFGKVDILINNAGGQFDVYSESYGTETTMLTNHVGPVYLTNLLINNFNSNAKIINVSSKAHNFCNNDAIDNWVYDRISEKNYHFWLQYSLSKLANIVHVKYLNNLFQEKGMNIKAAALHPGVVRTEFFKRNEKFLLKIFFYIIRPFSYIFFKGPLEGAQTTLHLAYLNYEEFISGGYYSDCRPKNTTELARNPQVIDKIMKKTDSIIENYLSNWGDE